MTLWRPNRRRLLLAVAFLGVVALASAAWLVLRRGEEPLGAVAAETQRHLARVDRIAAVAEVEVALATVHAQLGEQAAASDVLAARVEALSDRLEIRLGGATDGDDPSWDALAEAFDALESQLRDDDPAAERSAAALAEVLGRFGR